MASFLVDLRKKLAEHADNGTASEQVMAKAALLHDVRASTDTEQLECIKWHLGAIG